MHRLPRLWESPDPFNLERFNSEQSKAFAPFAYFLFGGGPRQCIGNTFAMMEMTFVIDTLAQRYRLNAAPGPQAEPAPWITLRYPSEP